MSRYSGKERSLNRSTKEGILKYSVRVVGESKKRGTTVEFLPDKQIFKVSEYNYETVATRLRELVIPESQDIRITLTDLPRERRKRRTQAATNFIQKADCASLWPTLIQLVRSSFRSRSTLKMTKSEFPVQVAMGYNTSFSENLVSYVNNINTHEGGTHVAGFRRALTRTLKELCG